MSNLHKLAKKILGKDLYFHLKHIKNYATNFVALPANAFYDLIKFYKHSNIFRLNTLQKKEASIILYYHAIEKGFLHKNFRYRFGQYKIEKLIKLLKMNDVVRNDIASSQISIAYNVICKYYEKHQEDNIDISDYFTIEDYNFLKNKIASNQSIIIKNTKINYFRHSNSEFFVFAESRHSVRDFTGEKIDVSTIKKVVDLSKSAPSVCNRQPNRIIFIDNKKKVDSILKLQAGLRGYTDNISQLLVLVSSRNYFYTVGERNQLYIDGGIFLMNLLYALHYYKIGACPAHWAFTKEKDRKIQKELNLNADEKVICTIPIGIPQDEFGTTLSLRRDNDEILKIVK